jgi:uncharacterized protein involved in exopolysaccharide biosynthesis
MLAGVLLAMGGIFLFFGGRAWLLLSSMPGSYEARVVIRSERNPTVESATNSAPHDPYFIQTEFEVIQSEMILDRVIAALDLNTVLAKTLKRQGKLSNAESRRLLKQSIELSPQPGVNLIEARVHLDDKVEVVNIANGIADAYFNYRQDQWNQIHGTRTNALQARLEELNREIETAQKQSWQLWKDLGVAGVDPADSTAPASIGIAQYTKSAIESQTEVVKWQNVLTALKTLDHKQLRNVLPTTVPDGVLTSLVEELNKIELELVGLQVDHGGSHPEVVRAKSSIDELNRKIDERVDAIMTGLKLRIAALEAVVQNSESKIEADKRNARETAVKMQPYFESSRRLQGLEQTREALRKDLEMEPNPPKPTPVEIVRRAEPPLDPLPRKHTLDLIVLALGVVFEIAGLLLLIRPRQAKLRPIRHEA